MYNADEKLEPGEPLRRVMIEKRLNRGEWQDSVAVCGMEEAWETVDTLNGSCLKEYEYRIKDD